MNFASDNVTGVHPDIMAALAAANTGAAMPYGNDLWSEKLSRSFCDLFETEVEVFPVATGSAANALALSALCPPFGSIYCHAQSHVYVDECGAPEFYTGGAKLITLDGEHGKIAPLTLEKALAEGGAGVVHHVQPAAVSITQATEAGTVYQIEDVGAIADLTHHHNLALHMDGARFANAVVSLGCSPADITWRAGVDVLSFGATKNGAMAAEAVIFFNPTLAKQFGYRRKRAGHLFSKMRFLSVQLQAYLDQDLWRHNATHANSMAAQLAQGLRPIPGVTLCHPVEANELFVELPNAMIDGLQAAGFSFYRWEGEGSGLVRLVTAFNTRQEDVLSFIAVAQHYGS